MRCRGSPGLVRRFGVGAGVLHIERLRHGPGAARSSRSMRVPEVPGVGAALGDPAAGALILGSPLRARDPRPNPEQSRFGRQRDHIRRIKFLRASHRRAAEDAPGPLRGRSAAPHGALAATCSV
jgi:hypothetical protein